MAIIIDEIKYACASCIRGHRVKKCNHSERQLIEVLKRGRQVSQCKHCRDLRKTKKSHVKCTCAISNTPNPINGCLCEVILSCSCVATHLQEVKADDEIHIPSQEETKEEGKCTAVTATLPINGSLVKTTTTTTNPNQQDEELFNFLYNDLNNYLSPTATSHFVGEEVFL